MGILPSKLQAAYRRPFFLPPWRRHSAAFLFWLSRRLAAAQFRLSRRVDNVALGVDRAALGGAVARHWGGAVRRSFSVERTGVVRAALPRAWRVPGAAGVALFEVHGESKLTCGHHI